MVTKKMLRWFPRRMRLKWVIFLLAVCFVGLYFTYKQLVESKQVSRMTKHPIDSLSYMENELHKLKHKPVIPVASKNKLIHNEIHPAAPMVRNLEEDSDYLTSEEKSSRLKLLLNNLSPSNWKTALDAGEMMSIVKRELSDMDVISKLSCQEIDALKLGSAHKSGYYGKKMVDHVMLAYPIELVIKSTGNDHTLKIECMKQDYNAERCANMANYKIMRELIYLLALEHKSIIDLKGFCLRGETIDSRLNMKGAIIVTEGSKQLPDGFYNFCWACRLEMLLDILELLQYLDKSPLGSLGFDQLNAFDFVLVDSTKVKLVDLDNLRTWEKPCQADSDCTIEEMPRKVIKCIASECKGRNSLNNLLQLSHSLLPSILKYPPASETKIVDRLIENIQNLQLTLDDAVNQVKRMLYTADPNRYERDGEKPDIKGGLTIVDQGSDKVQNVVDEGEDRAQNRVAPLEEVKVIYPEDNKVKVNGGDVSEEELESNKVLPRREQPDRPKQSSVTTRRPKPIKQEGPETKYEYERHDNANYPGQFDYTCAMASRVTWGCVVSVKGLEDAKSHCNRDPNCQAFVVFSSNPDQDALMTMVMKNSADKDPDPNYGATLFIKKKPVAVAIPPTPMSPVACKARAQNQTASARLSREKRLMTHLGLKGTLESQWKDFASQVKVIKVSGPSQLMQNNTVGGRFRFQFDKNDHGLTKGEFLAELGPVQYHVGYLITYFVDRILGLYHTPPAIVRKFSQKEMRAMKGDKSWLSRMSKFNMTDGSGIMGLLLPPVPPVMKTTKISIPKLNNMEPIVHNFTRYEKVQVEYILLKFLTKLLQPRHGDLGYKGHLIHFEADLAFQNVKQSLQGYFYNCQFPNIVYKTLMCYKCPGSTNRLTQICGLGEQAVDSAIQLGLRDMEIKVGSFTSTDLKDIINNSAAVILTIVDHCIRTHSREKVLY